jgi:hypothetical protein
MPIIKRVLCPRRLRRVPPGFSWIDHRLVRDKHIGRCSAQALALYLFLVAVCDGEGLSYYSDQTITGLLPLDEAALARARQELISADLIAYQRPLYQVLSLPAPITTTGSSSPSAPSVPSAPKSEQPQSIGQILKDLLP